MSDRQGIEIDYCPKCRGVWLDRGELDKIIERSAGANAGVQPVAGDEDRRVTPPQQPRRDEPYDERHAPRYGKRDDDDDDHYKRQHGKGYRKKSFLGDIFDF